MTELFDAFASCGGIARGSIDRVEPDDLAAEMNRVSIGRALVRFGPIDMDADAFQSLSMIYDICDAHESFVPCPLVVPNTAHDFIPEDEQVDNLVKKGAGAVTIRPVQNCWLIDEWCSGDLMHALEDRRVPVFCGDGQVTLKDVVYLAQTYPNLPLIMADNSYREQRVISQVLKQFKNVHISTGMRYNTHMALEHLTTYMNPDQIVFGTGWPVTEATASITYLTYADLSDELKQRVGSGNMNRLMEGIVQ